jgi:hypothetical protein
MVRGWQTKLYIKRGCSALEDFLVLSVYSSSCIVSNSTTSEISSRFLSLSLSLDTHFEFSLATSTSPAPDPARYIRTSPLYMHLIADVLSTLSDSLL